MNEQRARSVARRRNAGACSPRLRPCRPDPRLSLAALGLGALGACGGGGSALPVPGPLVPGIDPATGLRFLREAHHGGQAASMRLVGVAWGRLVDVRDVEGTLLHRDLAIGADIESDGVDYLLERNPVTGLETLTVLHALDTPAFDAAFERLERNLTWLLDKGLGSNVLPPYTMVARNAALVVRFDDLLADGSNPGAPGHPGTVTPDTVRLLAGYPPTVALEPRVLPDPNHGDLVDGRFHSTRVILDLSVSALEGEAAGVPPSPVGLPAAVTATQPNLVLRIPTRPSAAVAQAKVLENLSGGRVAFLGNGSNDPLSATLDVVRAARSGGTAPGDPSNGFLPDSIPPRILGAQAVTVALRPGAKAGEYLADLSFQTPQCAAAARRGDVVELPSHRLGVTADSGATSGGTTSDVELELLTGEAGALASPLVAVGRLRTAWDPAAGAPPDCFVRYSPAPGQPPGDGLAVDADVIVSFSEPMDPSTVLPLSSFQVEYGTPPPGIGPLGRRVIGDVRPSADLVDFVFEPRHPLRNHGDPGLPAESYLVSVAAGAQGVADLAGNPLALVLPPVVFRIDPAEPRVDSGGIALDFSSADEDQNGSPELRGQFFRDPVRGVIGPRPVNRFSVSVGPQQPMLQTAFLATGPVITPLSNLGSKLHTVWRYLDMGFSLLDDGNHNLDVEGLWWEPFGGAPKLDVFPEFEMRLAHAARLPDEGLNTGQLPTWPQSGLSNTFDANYADPVEDPVTVVHPRPAGYQVEPTITYSESGRPIAPWPFNRGKPESEFVYWTWRDTAKLMVAAPNGVGADPLSATQKLGGGASFQGFYPAGRVPSIGLPLLMEFRTYKNEVSSAQNGFQLAFALNSSANPFFRTFSTGGVLGSGKVLTVEPDSEVAGTGGVNPVTGGTTPSQDLNIYLGQADFVVRVSRVHSVWLDTRAGGCAFAAAVVEPLPADQPDGTAVALAFRGASGLVSTGVGTAPWFEAQSLDPYGDPYTAAQWMRLGLSDHSFTVTHWPDPQDAGWVSDPALLAGARYLQVRITLLGDAASGLVPELSGLGLSFLR